MKSNATILLFLCFKTMNAQQVTIIPQHQYLTEIAGSSYVRTGRDFSFINDTAANWQPVQGNKIFWNPFVTQWLYCKVANTGKTDRALKLWLNNVQAGVSRLFIVHKGKIDSSFATGSLLSSKQRATEDRLLSLPVYLRSGDTAELYLNSFRRQVGITITPLLMDVQHESANTNLDYWLVFGLSLMFVIGIIAVNIYFSFPSKELFWFAAYAVSTLFYSITISGFGSLYLWGSFPLFEENAAVFFGAVATACLFELSRLLFNTKLKYKKIDRFLKLFSIVNVIVSLLGFNLLINYFSPYTYGISLLVLYLVQVTGYCIIFVLSLITVFVQKQKEFMVIALLFGIILIVVSMLIMQETAVIPFDYRFHSYMIAFSLFPQTLIPLVFFVNRIKNQLQLRGEEIVKERLESEKRILNERLRLGKELHDDIGSTLSGIKLYSHLASSQMDAGDQQGLDRSLTTIQQSAEEMVQRINDQVWLMQHELQTPEYFLQGVVEYAGKMTASKNMLLKTNVDAFVLKEAAINYRELYLFCKEAINNAIKYSDATELVLSTNKNQDYVLLAIIDNGKGFDATSSYTGNGIKNMQHRAKEMGAQLQINSDAGNGTSLILKFKITQ
ncbi:MAG: hypothetical protein EOP47_12215 [Sphingobacteriaceae bacterium]|nr:MAG: hypothetical protein EOP47_12215 [Sphingobacteriaceae bacterium]